MVVGNQQLRMNLGSRSEQTEAIRDFILRNVETRPRNIARAVEERFGISRQSASKHLQRLIERGLLNAEGATRGRRYALHNFVDETFAIDITAQTSEDLEWRTHVAPLMDGLPANIIDVCRYGFTEMLNNVLDHSSSPSAGYALHRNAIRTSMHVRDSGVGIFNKIQSDFQLSDPRHALLELCKGKLTSDPDRHTGEGIFFTSRMFDKYQLLSGTLFFNAENKTGQDWLIEAGESTPMEGTLVHMEIANDSPITPRDIFEKYAADSDDYGFARTIVPVQLAQYEGEQLISRSQAKRLVARFDKFLEVALDFGGVTEIGPAFADEIFRVYKREHPTVHLYPLRASVAVLRVIQRVEQGETQIEA